MVKKCVCIPRSFPEMFVIRERLYAHPVYQQYLFRKAFPHVTMFIHHLHGVCYYVWYCYKIYKMVTFIIQVIVTEN
jgi:hypothetical protein